MTRPTRRAAIVLAAAAFAAALLLPATAAANHTWRGFHWARTSNPFTVRVGDNLGNGWKSYLTAAATEWTRSTVLDVQVVAGTSSRCDLGQSTGTIQVCNAQYGSTGWLGIASISISGKHIVASTVKLNDTYFNQSAYNTTAWKNLVMCQEVGHGFGLAHQDERFTNANLDTCMDYTDRPASNQVPNAHDYEQLTKIYNHVDSTSTLQGTSGFIANAVQGWLAGKPAEAAWGALVAVSAAGRSSTYVRELGGGARVVTHVLWLPDGHDHHHGH
ncbi:MAG: hypothetical protein RL338_621 [Chloroflexota bacterium]|jgi:hypothetical protein